MNYLFDDICDFYNGGAWSDKEYVNSGLPVLKVTNCKNNGFNIDDINYLPKSLARKYQKNKLQIGDVIIATVGSHPNLTESAAGRASIVNSQVEGFYLNQNAVCIRTKNNNVLDQGYLGYVTKGRLFQHYIQMRGRGAANQMRIAIQAIKSYEIDLPDIDEQKKIASILSAYDGLIENNQKQIKLLEEAAQRLYKEWFVNLRFPGYENVKIVDGVPEGWHYGIINEIASFRRGKTITKAQVKDGVVPVVAGGIEPAYYHNIANTAAPVVTVSASGANAGFTRLYSVDVFASDCSFVDSTITPHLFFVYLFLKNNKASLESLQKGSAQPHVYAKDINALSILVPPNSVMEQFTEICSHLFRKVQLLEKQVIMVQEARDRLLPKLISGEIMI